MPKATIWNPNTGQKQVVDVGAAVPAGWSLWTGGNASGATARSAIMGNKPVVPAAPAAPAPIDSDQQLAANMAAAGLNFDDFAKIFSDKNQPTQAEKDKIYADLGIGDLETSAYKPAPSTEALYTQKYSELGLQRIKDQIEQLNSTINTKKDEFNKALGGVNENPWLSESSRVGRAKRLQDLASADLANVIDQHKSLTDLYNSGINEINNHVTRATNDFQHEQTINQAKLNYLLKKAESNIANLTTNKASKVYRYLPDYLTSKKKYDAAKNVVKPSFSDLMTLFNSGLKLDENGNIVKDTSSSSVDDIANAIKQVESGGNYNARGKSGEYGAYQFMPGTWASWSSEYAKANGAKADIELNPSPENQDAVARFKISQWQAQGLTPEQIAAKWNNGSEVGWEKKRDTNSKGVKYDVPAYVKKVLNVLGKSGSGSQSDADILAQSIVDGTMSPSMLTKRTKDYNAILAKVKKIDPKFDLSGAQINYQAESKFAQSMNSTQMISFFNNSTAVLNSLNELKAVSDELKRSGIRTFNKAKIFALAETGNTAALKFKTVHTVLQEELAKVFMGNASPTDESLKLAAKALDQFGSHEQLMGQVEEVNRLISYRRNVYTQAEAFIPGNTNQVNGAQANQFDLNYVNSLGIK